MKNVQPKIKWLLLLVIILLIANAVSLYFLFNRPDQKSRYQEKRSAILNFLKNDVGFTDKQIIQFDSLSNLQKQISKPLFDKSADRKEQILTEAAEQHFSDEAIDTAATKITDEEKDFEIVMLKHLRDVRAICTTEQLVKFDQGFYKLIVKRNRNTANKEKTNH